MPLVITLNIQGLPSTSFECGEIAKKAGRAGRLGFSSYTHGMYFLVEASRMKNPRPQAQRLVLAWCQFMRALQYEDCPDNCMSELIPHVVRSLKVGMEPHVWPNDIEGPLKEQLNKAKSRKRILSISTKAVKAFSEFRAVFELDSNGPAEGLDASLFRGDWCLPVIDKHLDYWRDQLAFIETKIAEEAT